MRKNTRKVFPSIDDYDQGIDEAIDLVQMGAVELSELIEQKLENRPKNGEKSLKLWRIEANKMIDAFNSKYGKRFNKAK